jgi:antitoxin component of MazEF toxin-antitoxin module
MKSNIRKIGNSVGVILPKNILEQSGMAADAPIEVNVENGVIVIKAMRKRRPINTDLSTWRKQIKEAQRKGQTQDIGYWPEHLSSEVEGEL